MPLIPDAAGGASRVADRAHREVRNWDSSTCEQIDARQSLRTPMICGTWPEQRPLRPTTDIACAARKLTFDAVDDPLR
jgi:hypothetical protein